MTVWIVYDRERVKGNERFIVHLSRGLKSLGAQCTVVYAEDLSKGFETVPDAAVMRTYRPAVHRALEGKGVLVLNSFKTSVLGNDKYKGYLFAQSLGLDVMPFDLVCESNPPKRFPCVVKSIFGHGGSEVFFVRDLSGFYDVLNGLNDDCCGYPDKTVIAQDVCDTRGKDVRTYIIGNKIVTSVLRESDTDFRSNFSLGGKISPYTLNKNEIGLIDKITENTDVAYGAVDFIFHNGKPYFNEIEDIAGAKNLYMFSSVDILGEYAVYIVDRIKKRGQWN